MGTVLTTAWVIWGARCKFLVENTGGVPTETLTYALRISRETMDASPPLSAADSILSPHPVSWSKPAETRVKVNVDAGCLASWGSGLGVICRDANGTVLAAGTHQFQVAWEPRIAEAKAIYYGLKVALELGYQYIDVESDSLLAIQALRSVKGGSSDFNLIIEDILALASSFNNVAWCFVKRSRNKVAHMLAHLQP